MPRRRLGELVAGAFLLGLVAQFLSRAYVLNPDTDPVRWVAFGRAFGEAFGQVRLAYGFPLLFAVADAWLGPVRAYLVNLPVLLALFAAVLALARAHAPTPKDASRKRADMGTATAGFVALAALVVWNTDRKSTRLNSSHL